MKGESRFGEGAPIKTEEQRVAMETFVPRVRVRTPRGDGHVYTMPSISHATGQVCFGVRLDAGPGIIAKHNETEVIQ